jgi:hypothetical protein
MKSREPKSKVVNAESNAALPPANCPNCLSGIEPTIIKGDFGNALRESL